MNYFIYTSHRDQTLRQTMLAVTSTLTDVGYESTTGQGEEHETITID